jgi:hypothetical protein
MCAGFEVLTAVVMKVTIFWDIAPFSPYVNQRFGGTLCTPSSGSKIILARNQRASGWRYIPDDRFHKYVYYIQAGAVYA